MLNEADVLAFGNSRVVSMSNYRKAVAMLVNHCYGNARLYTLVIIGSDNRLVYQQAVERLCEKLRLNGAQCDWKSCYEIDGEKGLHLRLCLLVDNVLEHASQIIQDKEGTWLAKMLEQRGLRCYLVRPRNRIHWHCGVQPDFARVPKEPSPLLDDCIHWIAHLYRGCNKTGVQMPVYGSSRRKNIKRGSWLRIPPYTSSVSEGPFGLAGNSVYVGTVSRG